MELLITNYTIEDYLQRSLIQQLTETINQNIIERLKNGT